MRSSSRACAANRPALRTTAMVTTALAAGIALGGCSAIGETLGTGKVDYKAAAVKTATLEVPPDLTQLTNDPRYQPPSGAPVSANAMAAAGGGSSPAATAPTIAPRQAADFRIERDGNRRWLVTKLTPEELWPRLRDFWTTSGFELVEDKPELGIMQTGWKENRAAIPQDFIRRTIGRVFDGAYDSGERDRFRTRVERTSAGTEIYLSHNGVAEVAASGGRGGEQLDTKWQPRPSSPELEAEMLGRLMARLSTPEGTAQSPAAAASATSAAVNQVLTVPAQPARARLSSGDMLALALDDGFDRAWRRVGSALDRSSFTVEDRDRTQGTYFVRYVDPALAGTEDPGFFKRLFGAKKPELAGARYRVLVQAKDAGSEVTVRNEQGSPLNDERARNILQLLLNDLR